MDMATKLRKWGNSYGVHVPKSMAHGLGVKAGSDIRFSIEPINKKPTLDELVAKLTPENRYPEFDWGEPMGNEAW